MTEPREYLRISIGIGEFDSWIDENKNLLVNETVTAIEELMFLNLSWASIIKIELDTKFSHKIIIDLKVEKDDVEGVLEQSMEYAIEFEDYELAHRIKLLQEYKSEQKFQMSYEKLLKTNEVAKPKGRPTKIKKE
jgi:hypothetical protein